MLCSERLLPQRRDKVDFARDLAGRSYAAVSLLCSLAHSGGTA